MQPKMSRRTIAQATAKVLIEQSPAERKQWLKMLAAYLIDQKQTETTGLLVNDILRELAGRNGEVLVEIQSARALSETLQQNIKESLRDSLQAKRVVLRESVDASLLGGLVVKTPDARLDASLRSKLQQLASL